MLIHMYMYMYNCTCRWNISWMIILILKLILALIKSLQTSNTSLCCVTCYLFTAGLCKNKKKYMYMWLHSMPNLTYIYMYDYMYKIWYVNKKSTYSNYLISTVGIVHCKCVYINYNLTTVLLNWQSAAITVLYGDFLLAYTVHYMPNWTDVIICTCIPPTCIASSTHYMYSTWLK